MRKTGYVLVLCVRVSSVQGAVAEQMMRKPRAQLGKFIIASGSGMTKGGRARGRRGKNHPTPGPKTKERRGEKGAGSTVGSFAMPRLDHQSAYAQVQGEIECQVKAGHHGSQRYTTASVHGSRIRYGGTGEGGVGITHYFHLQCV